MTTATRTLQAHAIDRAVLDRMRAVGTDNCGGYDPSGGLPDDLRVGPRILRSYRADGSMNYDAIEMVPSGVDIEPALAGLLDREDVVEVHVRATEAQCFTYAVLLSGV